MGFFYVNAQRVIKELATLRGMLKSEEKTAEATGVELALREITAMPQKELVTVRSAQIVRTDIYPHDMEHCAIEDARERVRRQLLEYLDANYLLSEKIEEEKNLSVNGKRITLECTVAIPYNEIVRVAP